MDFQRVFKISLWGLIFYLLAGCPNDSGVEWPKLKYFPEMFYSTLNTLLYQTECPGGDWEGDYGDATAWAPVLLLSLAEEDGDPLKVELALSSAEHELDLLRNAPLYLNDWDRLGELYLGVIGLIKAYEYTGEERFREAIVNILDLGNSIAASVGGYIDAVNTDPFGPTVITGFIAYVNLCYAILLEESGAEQYQAHALNLIDVINDAAWVEEKGWYGYSREDQGLYLYPNAMMILLLIEAYARTNLLTYKERAVWVAEAVEGLWDTERGGYFTPEARVEDYKALSGQGYIIMAHLNLFRVLRDEKYRERVIQNLEWIERDLYQDGIVYHDQHHGRRSERFCTGCNFHLLYDIYLLNRI